MRYKQSRRLLPVVGILYLLLALSGLRTPTREIFPFFCWFLFPITPNVEERFELRVVRLGDDIFEQPVDYQTLKVLKSPMEMDLWISTQQLGQAIGSDRPATIEHVRRRLEANFLPAKSLYMVDRVVFDPLERWENGHVRRRTRLATYTSSKGCERIPWKVAR